MTSKKVALPANGSTGDSEVVGISGDAYTIWGLKRQDREASEVLRPLLGDQRAQAVSRWLALGFMVDQRATAVHDADYLGRETDRLIEGVQSFFEKEMRLRFDPAHETSLTRPIVDHVADSKRVLGEAQEKLTELLRVNFDPNDARSAVAKIAVLLNGLEAQLKHRFDPTRKDSVLGQFDERLGLLAKELAAPDGPFQAVSAELQALRLEVARAHAGRHAQAEVIERTPIKGGVFEDELERQLVRLARIQGDIVERTSAKAGPGGSKRGDFLVTLAGKAGTIVIEAKSGAIRSLPKLVEYLESAKQARSADLAIAVVRDADDMPQQARPFQFYDQGIVVSAANFEFAFRIARWVVAAQNNDMPEEVDAAAVHDAVAEVLAAVKRLRPARQQLGVIEKAADALRGHLQGMEISILDAIKGLEASAADAR